MALAMAVSAVSSFAADVAPFKFAGVGASELSAEWDRLLKYKIWGTGNYENAGVNGSVDLKEYGVAFIGQDVHVTDDVGYVGSAKGGLYFANIKHSIGGPLAFAGNFRISDGYDDILTGPSHFGKDVIFTHNSNDVSKVTVNGKFCNDGSRIDASVALPASRNDCGDDTIPDIETTLDVPTIDDSWNGFDRVIDGDYSVEGNSDHIINVPEGDGIYDIRIKGTLRIGRDARLYINMPKDGRPTRIFADAIDIASTRHDIGVMYNGKKVANKDYAGDLLFYTPNSIMFPAEECNIQGSFISGGMISFKQHYKFAGQLLAKLVTIDAEFKATDFRYVRFWPITFQRSADGWGVLREGPEWEGKKQSLTVELTEAPSTEVNFKYCFILSGDQSFTKDKTLAEGSQAQASTADIVTTGIPLCPSDGNYDGYTGYGTASFAKGSTTLSSPIQLEVVNDNDIEYEEHFKIHVFDLKGAVVSEDKEETPFEGDFDISIIDDDDLFLSQDFEINVTEDTRYVFKSSDFPVFATDGTKWEGSYAIRIVTKPQYKDSLKIDEVTVDYDGWNPIYSEILDGTFEIGGKPTGWRMVYDPLENAYGNHFDSLEFRVLRNELPSREKYKMYINIIPVNDAPVAHDTVFTVKENSNEGVEKVKMTGSIRVEDVDDKSFTYAWADIDDEFPQDVYDKINGCYEIDASTGLIYAKGSDVCSLNYESQDSVLVGKVVVSDLGGGTTGDSKVIEKSVISVTLKIEDVNEKPSVAANQKFEIGENAVEGDVVKQVTAGATTNAVIASDPDLPTAKNNWGKFTYSIKDNDNFAIDSKTGIITVKKTADLDFEDPSKNTFKVWVYVVDGGSLKDSAQVTIDVTDENDELEFKGSEKKFAVDENTDNNIVVGKIAFVDPDAADAAANAFVASLTDKNCATGKTCAGDLFKVTVVKDAVNDSLYVVISVANQAKLDYEALANNVAGTNVSYDVTISVQDHAGAADSKTVSVDRKITVNDVNEAHDAKDVEDSIPENSAKGTLVATLTVSDLDINDIFRQYTYEILDPETVPFELDATNPNKILVKDPTALNYEKTKEFTFKVKVYDSSFDDEATVVIKLIDKPEIPVICDPTKEVCKDIVCDPTKEICTTPPPKENGNLVYSVAENTATGTQILEFYVEDEDAGDLASMKVSFKDVNGSGSSNLFSVSEKLVQDTKGYKLVVSVKNGDLLDFETIQHEHKMRIIVEDAKGLKDSINCLIKVLDVNEVPVITNKSTLETDSLKVEENSKKGTVVGTVVAKDQDVWDKNLNYALVDAVANSGDAALFDIDSKGVITVARDSSLNYEKDSIYTVRVIVTDNGAANGFTNLSDEVEFVIKIKDKWEPPVIIVIPECKEGGASCHKCDAMVDDCDNPDVPPTECVGDKCGYTKGDTVVVSIKENSASNTAILEYYVEDEDLGADISKYVPSLVNTNNSGAGSLFDIKIEGSKAEGYKVVVFVKDGSKLDYETTQHVHEVLVIVAESKGSVLADTIFRVINILDVNEAPVITNKEDLKKSGLNVDENSVAGTEVGPVKVYDQDKWTVLSYKLVDATAGSGDAASFTIDSKGVIKVAAGAKLNYEVKKTYSVKVVVTDNGVAAGFPPDMSDDVTFTISLNNKPDKPVIIPVDCDKTNPAAECHVCDATIKDCGKPELPPTECEPGKCGYTKGDTVVVGIKENSASNTVVLEYYVEDEDEDADISKYVPSLVNTNASGVDSLFGIKIVSVSDGYKVVVYVKDGSKLDYETTRHLHEVKIVVAETKGSALADTVDRIIEIIDVNEAPFVQKNSFDLAEHNSGKQDSVGTVEWGDDRDLDGISNPEFTKNKLTVLGGDTTKFWIDDKNVIRTNTSFNYETDSLTYYLVVSAVDVNEPTLNATDTIWIHIVDVLEKPYVTTTEFDIDENPKNKEEIGVIKSKDLDDLKDVQKRKYALVDKDAYVEVTEDGRILVKDSTKFNHETTNSFTIKVRVTDPDGLYSDTTVTIKINDINEAPTIADKRVNVPEDTKVGTVVDTVKAVDPDTAVSKSTLTYTVIGGDSTVFKVDPKTGAIKLVDSLDYERRKTYTLVVQVDDGEFKDSATVYINVTDVNEISNVEITSVDNGDSVYVKPDSVYTRKPVVQLCWHTGRTEGKKTDWNEELCENKKLEPGENIVVKTYFDSTTNASAVDSVVIFYSNVLPSIQISANGDGVSAHNIYTIVETTDVKDTNIYVNKDTNDIFIVVHDPALALKGSKDSVQVIKIPTDLDTIHVENKLYGDINKVLDEGVSLDVTPSASEVRSSNADSSVNVSYTTKVAGVVVTVSYVEDKKGDVVKVPVTQADGKVTMEEVITVSYVTLDKDSNEITISYQADAITGKALNIDSEGNLMTAEAASKLKSDKGPQGFATVGVYNVSYGQISEAGDSLKVSYSVDGNGKLISSKTGDIGYSVSYTYTDICGNTTTKSVFIVLDKYEPKVEILSPATGDVIYSNFTDVKWTVDGVVQDTLNTQGLEKGANFIVRFYRDKAGNEASDTVFVIMKDSKAVALAVEQPVTEVTKEKVDEYYAKNPPEKGQTYSVSFKNPTTGKEVEVLKGGSFGQKEGSGEAPYPGVESSTHLGPTLVLDIKLPVISGKDGLATLDDILSSDGMVLREGIDATGEIIDADSNGVVADAAKLSVEDYIYGNEETGEPAHCLEEVQASYKAGDDLSKLNLYRSKLTAKIWIYTTLGSFVQYYRFELDLNDPDQVSDEGTLTAFMELKPDGDGNVRAEDGRLLATGAYVYKVEAKVHSTVLCDIPSLTKQSSRKKGEVVKNNDDLLKPFGYKRPAAK